MTAMENMPWKSRQEGVPVSFLLRRRGAWLIGALLLARTRRVACGNTARRQGVRTIDLQKMKTL